MRNKCSVLAKKFRRKLMAADEKRVEKQGVLIEKPKITDHVEQPATLARQEVEQQVPEDEALLPAMQAVQPQQVPNFNINFNLPFEDSELSFIIKIERATGFNSLRGSIRTNVTEVPKSFIVAQETQKEKLQELLMLSHQHESLLTVEHALELRNGRTTMTCLVTEVADSLDYFFAKKLQEHPNETNESWWKKIESQFWIIFRDIIMGLMYLFEICLCCGDLGFSLYVTDEGRGRILPSFTSKKVKEDFIELSNQMKRIIQMPQGKTASLGYLPVGLQSFFTQIDDANNLLRYIPSVFLIDHPYFWSIREKIQFSLKLKRLVRKTENIYKQFNSRLGFLKLFKFWFNQAFTGVYQSIFDKPKTSPIKPYSSSVDIIRYFGAVYTHSNDNEYRVKRQGQLLSDEAIEEALLGYFPHYYTQIYQCACAEKGELKGGDLMEVSRVYYKTSEHPLDLMNRARPHTS